MDVVYLIAAHQNPTMFGELLEALSPAQVVVHIDAKADIAPFLHNAEAYPNVRFSERRVQVNWGGWSQVAATLILLEEAMRNAADDDYVVLLSGDSYPLRSPSRIRESLLAGGGRQFLQAVPVPPRRPRGMPRRDFGSINRISQVMLEYDLSRGPGLLRALVNRLPVYRPFRRALGGRIAYTGSQWWALTGSAARFVLDA